MASRPRLSAVLRALFSRRAGAVEMAAFRATAWLPIDVFRRSCFRVFGASVDPSSVIYHGYQVRHARGLFIGRDCSIGDHAVLDCRGSLTIGNHVNVSTGVQFWTAQHDWRSPTFDFTQAAILVEDNVWIGPGVIVLPGSTIRQGSVVGAGAVVAGEIGPYELAVGVPARAVAARPSPMRYELNARKSKTWWW